MTTLDNPNNIVDESTVPFLPTALRFGLIAGLIFVVYTLIANMLGLSIPTSLGTMILQFVLSISITVGVLIYTIKHHRDNELGGYISFGRAFLVGAVALLISVVISNLFNLLYMTVIDPGFVDAAMEGTEEMMRSFGMDDEMVEKAMEEARGKMNPTSMITQGLLYGAIFAAVLSAIVAGIMKKKAPVV